MCCLIAASAVWGQATNMSAKPGVLGYLDPRTGLFRPIPQIAGEDQESPALTTVGGTITLTITITLKTTLTNVTCIAETSVSDGATLYEESNQVAATGTGGTKTCKLTIPYSWALANQGGDSMSTGYTVTGAASTGLPGRTATRTPLDVRKVPANGTTTPLTAAVTL
jgi:flagellar hook assembly protein FlgD